MTATGVSQHQPMRTGAQASLFYYTIGIAAILIYSAAIITHAYNMPKWDDFPDILLFLDTWIKADTVAEKYSAFISHTNEHILLVNHTLVLAQYYLIGHLNFSWLIYIGNLFYISSALALWLFFKDQHERAFIFAILILTGITFYAYDSTLWAMTSISNQAVITFTFLSIYFISRSSPIITLSMLFGFLAVFSQANGFFCLATIAGYLLLTKRKSLLITWLIFSFFIIGLYLYWFNPTSLAANSDAHNTPSLQPLNYALTLPSLIGYFGSAFFLDANISSILISVLFGFAIISTVIYQVYKPCRFTPPILALLAFLLMSAFSIAAYRGLIVGPQVIFISRYKMYAGYFLAVGVLLSPIFLQKMQQSFRWRIAILLFAIGYFSWSFQLGMARSRLIDTHLYQSLQNWVEDGDLKRAKGFFVKDADSYLFSALKNKTYTPMVLLPTNTIISDVTTLSACPINNIAYQPYTDAVEIMHINPNAAGIKLTLAASIHGNTKIILCSTQLNYEIRLPVRDQQIQASTLTLYIPRELIGPGAYTVYLQNNDVTQQTKAPFINKINKR